MYRTLRQLLNDLNGAVRMTAGEPEIIDITKVHSLVDAWVYTYVFSPVEKLKEICRYLIRYCAYKQGIYPASIHELYMARGEGEVGGFTVPAVNIRGMTYDIARRFFKIANQHNVGAIIYEIARSEIGYTNQPPDEYATVVIAAALKESFTGPLFIQGDHFQIKKAKFGTAPDAEIHEIESLIVDAIRAGFYNIDIDASTLVEIGEDDLRKQQKLNSELTAHFTKFIREHQPNGVTISIGGEIGEVGGRNSTTEDLDAFMQLYLSKIKGLVGLSKISVQTGTTHGGVVLPDGSLAQVKVDFGVLKTLSQLAREKYGMAGTVQHGASTLPIDAFGLFPESETAEIHLATQFQNIVYDSPELPQDFKEVIYDYLFTKYSEERKPEETDTQFLYKTRKKGFGPFKWDWWTLSSEIKEPILERLDMFIETLVKALKVDNTKDLVARWAKKTDFKEKIPEHLKVNKNG